MAERILRSKKSYLDMFGAKRDLSLGMLIIVLFVFFSICFPKQFLTYNNVGVILMNASAEGLLIVAMALVLIMGEIDLSLGANMVLGGIVCGRLMILGHAPVWVAILVPLLVSILLGYINGIIITKIKVVSFIATLATSMIYLGIAVMLAGTGWTDFPDPLFQKMGQLKVAGFIQLPVIYATVVIVIFSYLMAKTKYFRQLYFIGGNIKAAVLSGINIDRTKITIYMIASFLACLAGIISAMRFNASMTSSGTGVELRAVTAAVLGGVSFLGGTGTILGAAIGGLFLSLLVNALSMAQISSDIQTIVTGMVLILALVIDMFSARKNK